MNLYTEQQMRDAIKMARNGARSEDNIIDSLNFIKQHSEVTMSNNKQIEKPLELPHQETIVGTNTIQTKPFDNQKTENMSNNKQSSVEWFAQKLYETLEIRGDGYVIDSLLDLAKAMHKKECVDLLNHHNDIFDTSKDHYNQTFGGNN